MSDFFEQFGLTTVSIISGILGFTSIIALFIADGSPFCEFLGLFMEGLM